MNKCEHFKDIILTDYLDGRLEKTEAQGLEGHLLDCAGCRAFLNEVKSTMLPLQQVPVQAVPDELWKRVSAGLQAQNSRHPVEDLLEKLLEKLKGLVVFPRLVPVFASLALMLIVGTISFNTIKVQQAKDRDQGAYLVAMLNPAGTPAGALSESGELGTPIEHYFL